MATKLPTSQNGTKHRQRLVAITPHHLTLPDRRTWAQDALIVEEARKGITKSWLLLAAMSVPWRDDGRRAH